jgi:hypothetical protein
MTRKKRRLYFVILGLLAGFLRLATGLLKFPLLL